MQNKRKKNPTKVAEIKKNEPELGTEEFNWFW